MFTRNFTLLLLGNIILIAPMPMLIILGALVGGQLAPNAAWATLPPTMQLFAGVVIAAPISLYMARFGRRNGLFIGVLLALIGGVLGALALYYSSFIILCIAHFCIGGALICIGYIRFAAAEAVPEKYKSSAISFTLASGLIAALISPEIFAMSKDSISNFTFAGSYLAISALALLGLIPIFGLSKTVTKTIKNSVMDKVNVLQTIKQPTIFLAIFAAAIAQCIMVLLMVPTPLAMVEQGFSHHNTGDVIRWHVVAMFAPGFFTGWLIQKFGSVKIIITGLLLLAAAAVIAISGMAISNFYLSLIILGLGWNFGFIGGSHLLQTSLAEKERGALQGINDTILALAGTIASLSSGTLFAYFGWASLSIATIPIIACSIGLIYWLNRPRKTPVKQSA